MPVDGAVRVAARGPGSHGSIPAQLRIGWATRSGNTVARCPIAPSDRRAAGPRARELIRIRRRRREGGPARSARPSDRPCPLARAHRHHLPLIGDRAWRGGRSRLRSGHASDTDCTPRSAIEARSAAAPAAVKRRRLPGPRRCGTGERVGQPMARATGVIVGLTAAWIKALTEPALQSAAERILPPSPDQKHEVGADPSGRPENMPPAVLADRRGGDRPRRPDRAAAAPRAAGDPLRLRRGARCRVSRRREPLAGGEPGPGRARRARDLRGHPRLRPPRARNPAPPVAAGPGRGRVGVRRRTSCSAPRWRPYGARWQAGDDQAVQRCHNRGVDAADDRR